MTRRIGTFLSATPLSQVMAHAPNLCLSRYFVVVWRCAPRVLQLCFSLHAPPAHGCAWEEAKKCCFALMDCGSSNCMFFSRHVVSVLFGLPPSLCRNLERSVTVSLILRCFLSLLFFIVFLVHLLVPASADCAVAFDRPCVFWQADSNDSRNKLYGTGQCVDKPAVQIIPMAVHIFTRELL